MATARPGRARGDRLGLLHRFGPLPRLGELHRFGGSPRFGRLTFLILVVAAGAATSARADYKETYRKGIEAVDRKRWPEVARLMREAIAENAKEGERVKLYGLRFEAYVPQFYLGLALANTGDCAGAVRAFDASEAAGAIRGTPRYAELLDGRKACASRVASAATAPPPAAPTPPTAQPPTKQPPPAPELAKPTPDPRAARDDAALKPTAPPAQPASPSPAASAAAEAPGLPPAGLMRAARAYFDGRYEESLALLARPADLRGRAAAQSHLFRAAARFALYRVGREQDASLRDLAARDVAACRRADASLSPDAQAFSPAFAEFFRRNR